MMRMLVCASVLASASLALADDEETPKGYEVWLDGALQPHPGNDKTDSLIEGDTLTVHVDPTRLFPEPKTPMFALGFAADSAPPDVLGFYVVGPGAGKGTELLMQPGLCGRADYEQALEKAQKTLKETQKKQDDASKAVEQATKARDGATNSDDETAKKQTKEAFEQTTAALKVADKELADATAALQKLDADPLVAEDPKAALCAKAPDWALADSSAIGYACGADEPLKKRLAQSPTWSLVQRRSGDSTKQDECLAEWTLGLDKSASAVTAEVFNGAAPAEKLTLATDGGRFATTIPIKANARQVRMTVTYDGGRTALRTIAVKARPRDNHTRLRLQAELLAANRLRAISFAVALTPVRRAFFTKGPGGCVFGCALTASAVLRIAGDDKTVVQFGGAVGLNFLRAFQVNGGLLFGTNDTNSAWRIERNWFVGIAIDPIILSEAITTGSERN